MNPGFIFCIPVVYGTHVVVLIVTTKMTSKLFLPSTSRTPSLHKCMWSCRRALSSGVYRRSALREATPTRYPPQPWRIVAATCVQRMPLLSRERSELEVRVEKLKDKVRWESSRLSDFELELRENNRLKKDREKRALEEDLDEGQSAKDDSLDAFDELIEARETELSSFTPAPRETEADRNNDFKSVQRKLDQILYLLVKKDRAEHAWQMPQGGMEESESLLETAQRELSEECGSGLQVTFLSSAPSAHLTYEHDKAEETRGSKVFFFKANYAGGDIELNEEEVIDYVWVTKEEMKDYVSNDLYSCITPALPQ